MKELEEKIRGIIKKHYDWTYYGEDSAVSEIISIFKSQLPSELIAYDTWICNKYWGKDIPPPDETVKIYLKLKK